VREKGITPTYHVDVDPRQHKAQLIGDDISSETEFLMCSICHPKVFDHLEKYTNNITLWHGYDGNNADEVLKIIPKGEWVLTGGSSVGLRALVICRFLGFTNIHIFGMDGNFPKDGLRHASYHPNAPKEYVTVDIEGITYYTTPAYYLCAQQFFHEWKLLPDVNITLHGNGMVQHMAFNKMKYKLLDVRAPASSIAFLTPPNTISRDYIFQNKMLHSMDPSYGCSAANYITMVRDLYNNSGFKTLLDYGCGKGTLSRGLDFPIWEYDPAIEGKDQVARPADLVVCIDVLEHIEFDYLDYVLKDLKRCTNKLCFATICSVPSSKVLSDGRNAHLIQQDIDWWRDVLSKFFIIDYSEELSVDEYNNENRMTSKVKRIIMRLIPKNEEDNK
jgi:hypothetical protein